MEWYLSKQGVGGVLQQEAVVSDLLSLSFQFCPNLRMANQIADKFRDEVLAFASDMFNEFHVF